MNQTKQKNLLLFAMGIIMLFQGITSFAGEKLPETVALLLIIMGIFMSARTGLRLRAGDEGPEQDERTKIIGGVGLSWSWFLTLILMFAVMWIDALDYMHFTLQNTLFGLIIIMLFSAVISQWWLFKTGSIE